MAAKSEWSCPICRDDQDDMAYMSPCLHKFCLGCALRWAWQKPNCPLCRSGTTAIFFSVWSDDDYLVFDIPSPADPQAEHHQDEQQAAGLVPRAQVGGFPPAVWADFFQSHPSNIRPLLPWVRRELGVLFRHQWWEVAAAEGTVVAHLCLYGLDEEMLVQQLHNCLPGNAATFIHRLINTTVRVCGRAIRRHLGQQGPRTAWVGDERPAASRAASRRSTPAPPAASYSSATGSNVEEEAGRPQASLRRSPGRPPAGPVPAEQEQPQEEPQEEPEEAAAAGPSAQGCSRSPSARGRGRNRSPGGPRRPRKRRSPGTREPAQTHKRPPRRRH
ncbi:TOPRS ligase, partial [Pandion haliaetus]|nr:TOPRS ligase [Pandion haliaetus]